MFLGTSHVQKSNNAIRILMLPRMLLGWFLDLKTSDCYLIASLKSTILMYIFYVRIAAFHKRER